MKPVMAETIRWLDRQAAERFGLTGLALMENAGRAVATILAQKYPPCAVAVFAGNGNNGGDGLVAARYLSRKKFDVAVFLLGDPGKLKPDPAANYSRLRETRALVHPVSGAASANELFRMVSPNTTLILDAIFGVGLTRAPQGIYEAAIRAINLAGRAGRTVVSIDLPSGLDSDTGKVFGFAVMAARTLTLALPKIGLTTGQGPDYAGIVDVIDIGLPQELLAPFRD